MDLQFVAYQIFSSIGVEGYGKRRETTITGIISACYIVLVVYKLSKCHWSGRLTLDHKRARRSREREIERRETRQRLRLARPCVHLR